jgi:hypothetical protein
MGARQRGGCVRATEENAFRSRLQRTGMTDPGSVYAVPQVLSWCGFVMRPSSPSETEKKKMSRPPSGCNWWSCMSSIEKSRV